MKPVILGADGPKSVYMVPDIVANHLKEYCLKFCNDWLLNSPEAIRRYHTPDGCLCYNETAFIDYLNKHLFPDQPSFIVPDIEPAWHAADLPREYRRIPHFNF